MQDRIRLITLQKLRIFAAVAREGGFAKAADAVYISSPTVSEEIRSLENILGLTLINRSRGVRHLELTEAGQILLEGYDEISLSLAKIAKALDAIKGLQHGTVAFGADVIFGGYLLPLLHQGFCQDHAGIRVQVEIDRPQRILESLRLGQLDIAVLFGPNEQTGLVQEPLIPCYMVPIGSPGHRLAGEKPAPFSELAKERLVLPGRFSLVRRSLDRMADEAGVSLNVALETGNVDAVLEAVLGGYGVGVLNTYYFAAKLASRDLSVLQIEGFPLRVEWFVTHGNTSLAPSAQAFKDYLLHSKSLLESRSQLAMTNVK